MNMVRNIYDTWDESNVVHVDYGESVLPIT